MQTASLKANKTGLGVLKLKDIVTGLAITDLLFSNVTILENSNTEAVSFANNSTDPSKIDAVCVAPGTGNLTLKVDVLWNDSATNSQQSGQFVITKPFAVTVQPDGVELDIEFLF